MEIKKLNLLDILQKSQVLSSAGYFGTFRAPVDLLEVVLDNFDLEDNITLGLMFLQKKGDEEYIVVDGMKRLISLSLFLHAICECYKMTNEKNIHAIELIKTRYLFNKDNETKIKLCGYEKNIYEKLVKYEKMTDEEKEHPMFMHLHDYWAKIKMDNISAVKIFNEIKKMDVLCCVCENFEIENRDLYNMLHSNVDEIALISDFVKENAKESLQIWQDTLNNFKDRDLMPYFTDFLKNYLTIQKNGVIPEFGLYMSFKRYFRKNISYRKQEDIFKNIKNFSEHYLKILRADFENENVKNLITKINESDMKETYPYLLEVVDDYEENRITDETIIELLNMVITFLQQKQTGMLDRIINFGNLSQEINKRMS